MKRIPDIGYGETQAEETLRSLRRRCEACKELLPLMGRCYKYCKRIKCVKERKKI
jgi:hypothetical protein